MTIGFRFTVNDGGLSGRWTPPELLGSVDLTADFVNPNPVVPPPDPGIGSPDPSDPSSLPKLYPVNSKRVVVSILGASLLIEGVQWGSYITSFDLVRPMNGETQGVVELRTGRGLTVLDPTFQPSLKAGSHVEFKITLPGQEVPLLLGGYIVEPPKYRIDGTNVGNLSIRVGDIFLLKRQSETGAIDPYCGELPQTTAQAAQIFARVRGLPGVFGGEALVENINPDFIEGPPWDFLSSLYEVLDFDVRTTVRGVPIAVPRTVFNVDTALVLEDYQVSEADWDAPTSLPFSKVPSYNNFNRSLGFRVNESTEVDYSGWNAANNTPWFESNNTYTETTTTTLGDTAVQVRTRTWGYIPNSTVIAAENLSGSSSPCGGDTPASPVSTRLDIIQTRTFRAYFEPHISGGYLVTGTEENIEGWDTYQNGDLDTVLYFGQLTNKRVTYSHTAVEDDRVCPQYWNILRVGTDETSYSRVSVADNTEPAFQLTARTQERWAESTEDITEGQVRSWKKASTNQTYDVEAQKWVGGAIPVQEEPNPPSAQFINTYKVPVNLEAETTFPELVRLFGERESKPIQFPNAYTTRELIVSANRYARESAGLAYSIHLLVDPRVPIQPGTAIRYRRPGGSEVHGLAWTVEYNCTGSQVSQSVVLMRTFTEPSFSAVRNNPGFVPTANTSAANPCI